jgi:hypothetical protein
MSKKAATVTVKRLATPHQAEPFTQFKPLSPALKDEVCAVVAGIYRCTP